MSRRPPCAERNLSWSAGRDVARPREPVGESRFTKSAWGWGAATRRADPESDARALGSVLKRAARAARRVSLASQAAPVGVAPRCRRRRLTSGRAGRAQAAQWVSGLHRLLARLSITRWRSAWLWGELGEGARGAAAMASYQLSRLSRLGSPPPILSFGLNRRGISGPLRKLSKPRGRRA